MLDEIYRVLTISIGVPPKEFTYQYKDKGDKDNKPKTVTLPTLSPKEFYDQYIAQDLDEYIPLAMLQSKVLLYIRNIPPLMSII